MLAIEPLVIWPRPRRESTKFGHYRYLCVPTDEAIQALRNRASPPNAVVIGRRDAGGWTFYYQVYSDVGFSIKRQLKMSGIALGSGEFIMRDDDDTKRKKYFATVVLAYGELWPNMTEVSCTFGATPGRDRGAVDLRLLEARAAADRKVARVDGSLKRALFDGAAFESPVWHLRVISGSEQ